MNKRQIIWTIVIIAIIALLTLFKISSSKSAQTANNGKKKGPAAPVSVGIYVVKKSVLNNSIQTVGNILANEEVDLKSETQGKVVKINFNEGQQVHKGQWLVKINDADLQAQLKKALSTKKLKDETEKRNKQLLAKGAISTEAYDLSLTDLNSINADIDLLKEQIRRTEIIAPFNGLIGLRNISEGSFINNTITISHLQNIDQVKIEFAVPEKYTSKIRNGMLINFTVEGQKETFTAKIYAIDPKIDPVNRNVIARAICNNPNKKLLPGAFAKVNITLDSNPDALLIPTQAIVPILKGQKVFLIQGDSAIEKQVTIGNRNDLTVEVIDGLNENDSVIVQGVIQMKKGAKVKVTKP
ncbi:MAG: efflux RND transporter periplasmic adaptor subunit [Bacteroidota bacterium]